VDGETPSPTFRTTKLLVTRTGNGHGRWYGSNEKLYFGLSHEVMAVGGVAVEGVACSVVAAGGAGVGVAGGVLDVFEGDAGFAGAGDEGHPQRAR
jgi:hypothetical protein